MKEEKLNQASLFPGTRLAKVMARAGIASRRECETYIKQGRVSVNGRVVDSPAVNVRQTDRIVFDMERISMQLPAPRVWILNKPLGVEVSRIASREGRKTVFDLLGDSLGYVISVGRLDINSKGLLLLTNHGGLARHLELPSTGWRRVYRVRVFGELRPKALDILKNGIRVDGELFSPIDVKTEKEISGRNQWLRVSLSEGKNREVRRALGAVGLVVNELIRLSYGPFSIGSLSPGQLKEVSQKAIENALGQKMWAELSAFEKHPPKES